MFWRRIALTCFAVLLGIFALGLGFKIAAPTLDQGSFEYENIDFVNIREDP